MEKSLCKKIILMVLVLSLSFGLIACANAKQMKVNDEAITGEITIVSREDGSGTRGSFVELVGVKEGKNDMTTQTANFQDGNGKVIETVKNDPNALGYASLGSVSGKSDVKLLKVDDIEATSKNVLDGKYSIARPFNIAWSNERQRTPETIDFVNFILSKEGQAIVSNNDKYIAIDTDAKEFQADKNAIGEVMITGSTSVSPLMEKLAEAYMAINDKVVVKISSTGSSAGMKDAVKGNNDIGMASRELKDEEVEKLEYTAIAKDGIAIIVNKDNPLDNIKFENISKIYKGEIKNWEDIN